MSEWLSREKEKKEPLNVTFPGLAVREDGAVGVSCEGEAAEKKALVTLRARW